MQAKNHLQDLSVDRIRADLEHICGEIPTRLAGTPAGRKMAEFAHAQLTAAGAQSRIESFPGLVSFPEETQFSVLGDKAYDIAAYTLGHSVPTSAAGITAELIFIGSGGYEDYAGKDVTGKIVLLELSYHPGRHEKQRIAAEQGAVGCAMMNWGPDDNPVLPFGSVKPAWGNPTPEALKTEMATLPCVGISREQGIKLKGLCAQAPVRVTLRAKVDNAWKEVHIVCGEIEPGLQSPSSKDFVIAGGHADSWYGPQATDNAAGSACLLELARFFNKHRKLLRRGVHFGFWTGHETGTMVGSTWYVDQHWDNLREHGVAYLQIDQPCCAGTSRWGSVSNSELRDMQESLDAALMPEMDRSWRRTVKIGDASFYGVGVPMMSAQTIFTQEELKRTANAGLGWWHHSIENTPDKVDFNQMGMHIRAFAAYLFELCTAVILPNRFRHVAKEIEVRLQTLATAGKIVGLDSALDAAKAFSILAEKFDRKLDQIVDGGSAERHEQFVNDTLKKLSRILLPVVGTTKDAYTHDTYSFTPQTTVLPGLYETPELEKLEGEAKWSLQTKLRRERNRVVDAINEASERMRACMDL